MAVAIQGKKFELDDPDYYCGKCEQRNIKLWRDVFNVSPGSLLCIKCIVEKNSKLSFEELDLSADGKMTSNLSQFRNFRTDQIAGRVPAVPSPGYYGYWSYTAVPEEYVDWWKKLPNF